MVQLISNYDIKRFQDVNFATRHFSMKALVFL